MFQRGLEVKSYRPVLPVEERQLAQGQALCHVSLFPHLRTVDQGENFYSAS